MILAVPYRSGIALDQSATPLVPCRTWTELKAQVSDLVERCDADEVVFEYLARSSTRLELDA